MVYSLYYIAFNILSLSHAHTYAHTSGLLYLAKDPKFQHILLKLPAGGSYPYIDEETISLSGYLTEHNLLMGSQCPIDSEFWSLKT